MYEQIIEKGVKGQPFPDLVFLTGDMALLGPGRNIPAWRRSLLNP